VSDLLRHASHALRPRPLVWLSQQPPIYLPPGVSAEPGPLSLDRTPYLREPLDRLSPLDPTEIVAVCAATQLGKSTLAMLAWAGWVRTAPAPCLWVTDTDAKAEELAKYRVEPVILATPDLLALVPPGRSREKGNTTQLKAYPGGYTRWSGAQTVSGLTSMQARYAILDELDDHAAATLGDTVRLALGRTTTYGRSRKVLAVSSPSVAGQSQIDAWYRRGDRRRYLVPCPHCGHEQPLDWRDPDGGRYRLVWEPGSPETAAYLCAGCGRLIEERHKPAMLAAGRWQPTGQASDRSVTSYHLSALYAPLGWLSWAQLAAEWDQVSAGLRRGDQRDLRVYLNTRLAETWEDRGDQTDPGTLAGRGERWGDRLPSAIRLITCGVDVQEDRLEATILGIGPGWEMWVLRHAILRSDPLDDRTWGDLDRILATRWETSDGRTLGVALCAVDAGYLTSRVIDYARRRSGIMAIRGVSGAGKPIWNPRAKVTRRYSSAALRYHWVGTDAAKDWLYQVLLVTVPGPRYLHVPLDLLQQHPDWPAQVASERRVKVTQRGRQVWAWRPKPGSRQEALDCLIYAIAAAHAVLRDRPHYLSPDEPAAPVPQQAQPNPQVGRPRPAPRRQSSAGGGWLTGRGRL